MTHILPRMRFFWILFLAVAVCLAISGCRPTPPTPTPTGITASMLHTYDFTTPVINGNGDVTNRNVGHATYFTETTRGVNFEMTYMPAGTFWMGSTDDEVQAALVDAKRYETHAELEWFTVEQPRHQVRVPSSYMGRYPVTIGQWKAVMGDIPERMKNQDHTFMQSDNQPVQYVSWDNAQEFCRRLSQATGRQYRLPSEAEWEYAARAGTTTAFAFGDNISPEVVNYNGESPYGKAVKGKYREKTVVVGSLGVANAFGLSDMMGNVFQWCQDSYHPDYQRAPTDGSAWESGGIGETRVLRGGSWFSEAGHCRSAHRFNYPPGIRFDIIGFRVVVSAVTP